jgi:hypothetical protein
MAITGDAFTTYLNSAYLPKAMQTVFWNSWWANPDSPFEIVTGQPGGPDINELYDYGVSTNAEVYVRGAPMPDPDTLNSIRAYFTKDHFQASAKVYGDVQAQAAGAGGLNVPISMQTKAIDTCLKNLVDLMSTTFITDLGAQVDSTTALGDGSLTRATYSLASYESAVGGALALSDIEDMIEALQDTTYGVPSPAKAEDLILLMPRNQFTNLARLQGGATNFSARWDMGNPGAKIDAGRMFRQESFEGVDILVVHDLTTTEIYCVRKDSLKIYLHDPIKVIPKDVAEYADAWLATGGANLVVDNVRQAGKLTGVTA